MNSEDTNHNKRKSTSITNTQNISLTSNNSNIATSHQLNLENALNNVPFVNYKYRTLPSKYNYDCPLINIVNALEYNGDESAANKLKQYLPTEKLSEHMKKIGIKKQKKINI